MYIHKFREVGGLVPWQIRPSARPGHLPPHLERIAATISRTRASILTALGFFVLGFGVFVLPMTSFEFAAAPIALVGMFIFGVGIFMTSRCDAVAVTAEGIWWITHDEERFLSFTNVRHIEMTSSWRPWSLGTATIECDHGGIEIVAEPDLLLRIESRYKPFERVRRLGKLPSAPRLVGVPR